MIDPYEEGVRDGVTDLVREAEQGRGLAARAALLWAAKDLDRLPGRGVHAACSEWLRYRAEEAVQA